MKKVSVFNYFDYKEWLSEALAELGHGAITRIAKTMGCQRSYLSQVVTGHVHLTPDQAYKLSQVLLADSLERKYLGLLVDFARAQDRDFRAHLIEEIEKVAKESKRLENTVGRDKELVEQSAKFYYSAWYWSALHIVTSLESDLSAQEISKLLSLEYDLVLNCLNELENHGLVEKVGASYKYKTGGHHLRRESPLLAHFHWMWRSKAISLFSEQKSSSGLHYTVVQAISNEDYEQFQDELRQVIEKFSRLAEPSRSETVINFNIDFCKVTSKG